MYQHCLLRFRNPLWRWQWNWLSSSRIVHWRALTSCSRMLWHITPDKQADKKTSISIASSWSAMKAPATVFFDTKDPIHFLSKCHKRWLYQGWFGFVRFSSQGFFLECCTFGLSVPQPSDRPKRLVPKMTYYVSSGMINSAHSLVFLFLSCGMSM